MKRYSSNKTQNRKYRKALWRRAREKMVLYPDCAYNGDFYCNHVYDPEHPWVWVDFRFFHTKLKRYFAVAMTTLEYSQYENNDLIAYDKTVEELGELPSFISSLKKLKHFDPELGWLYGFEDSPDMRLQREKHIARQLEIANVLNSEKCQVKPSIKIKDYGPVVVGVWATVNRKIINENVIREFIAHFRSLGEPTKPGWTWFGEEVEIVPSEITKRGEYSTSAS